MARLFSDGAGTTYDAVNGKFVNVPFSTYTPFNFTDALLQPSTTVFKQKVDNSLAGNLRDCAECHVGGGGNEYVPNKRPEARTSLRDYVFGTAVTAFNYFIDSYGTKGDGTNLDGTPASFAPTVNDYSQTGVLEMDCLMCHLKDYKWEERKHAVRVGKFDASRVAGAGLGTPSTTPEDGINVTYDPTRVVPTGDNTALKLANTVVAGIQATPDANNCADCHMREHSVDWKKRGDQWLAQSEVHYSIGCMGCHKRKDADFSKVGTSGFAGLKGTYGFGNISTNHPLDDSKKLGQCDPAKGTAPYGSLWNASESNKFAVTKNCAGCHIYGGDYDPVTEVVVSYDTNGAPNPTAAHQTKGLTARIVQKGGTMAGAANASHIDLMTCETCHARKLGNFSGGAMVDGTGTDAEGRLADHENTNVTRTSMTNNTFMSWQASNGQMYNANLSTSGFWRDKNDVNFDANNDARAGGMDALLQTHVANINKANAYTQGPRAGQPLVALTQLGTVTSADVADHINAIDRDLEVQLGLKAAPGDANTRSHATRLSFMGVTFKTNHNISAASTAWGAKGCAECHTGSTSNTVAGTITDTTAAGFYSGKYMVKGDTLNMAWTSTQITPFASVNGSTQASDLHPGVKERSGVRSIAVQYASNGTTFRDIDRSEGLYENAFKARNTAFNSSITGTAITFPAAASTTTTSQGWLLKIEATNNAGQTIVARTKQVSALVTDMTGLLTNLGAGFTGTWDGTAYTGGFPQFGIRANAAGTGLLIEGRNGYTVRIHPQSDVGPLGLAGSLWLDKFYRGIATDGAGTAINTTDRKTWVAYLNSFGDPAQQAKVGLGVDPKAQFSAGFPDADLATAGNQLIVNTPYTLAADTAVNTNGTFTYTMTLTDGTTVNSSSISKTFTAIGTYGVILKVTDEEGKTATATKSFYVVNPPVVGGMTIAPATARLKVPTTFTFANLKDHDSLRIIWADGTSLTMAHVGGAGSSATADHAYLATGTKKLTVLVYKNGVLVDTKYNYVTVTL